MRLLIFGRRRVSPAVINARRNLSGVCGHWYPIILDLHRFFISSVVLLTMMVIFFCECTFPPLVEIRENPEFHDLMNMDKGYWPRCLLWRGWLPMLSGVNGASPWAAGASESASYLVETALGSYSCGMIAEWGHPDDYDGVRVASLVPDQPNVWSDGSVVLDRVTGISSSGAGFFAHQSDTLRGNRRWGHVDQVRPGSILQGFLLCSWASPVCPKT